MDSISYSLGIVLAANLKNQGFSDINTEELAQGFADSPSGEGKLTVEDADAKIREMMMKVQEEKSISCTIEEGGLVLFSSRTPHASFPNKSNKNRPAYLCQYSSEPIIPPPGSNKKFRAELI